MKVVLLQDLVNLGKKFDIKEVSDGYARNFLLPKQLAKIATSAAVKDLTVRKEAREKERQEKIKELNKTASEIKDLTLEFKLRGGKKGEVFSSISKSEIKKSLEEKGFRNLEVDLVHPLRVPGKHEVIIKLGEGIKANLKIVISV